MYIGRGGSRNGGETNRAKKTSSLASPLAEGFAEVTPFLLQAFMVLMDLENNALDRIIIA